MYPSRHHLLLGCLFLLAAATPAWPVALDAEQKLGRQLYRDRDLSLHHNQACATCHSLQRTRDTDGLR